MGLATYSKHQPSTTKLTVRFFSYIIMTLGFGLLVWSLYPIVSYEVSQRLYARADFLSPVREDETITHARANAQSLSQNVREFISITDWFPSRPQRSDKSGDSFPYTDYWLSIPKLNIKDAKVRVGGDDLANNLVHYLPSTEPGEYGTVNIFGHSTLPQLYNVKDYKTIFTYLPNLSQGDTIRITAGGQEYEYEIFSMEVVTPDKVSVLEPKYDASYLTLITCVPPGTYWNRLVVRARMKHLPFSR